MGDVGSIGYHWGRLYDYRGLGVGGYSLKWSLFAMWLLSGEPEWWYRLGLFFKSCLEFFVWCAAQDKILTSWNDYGLLYVSDKWMPYGLGVVDFSSVMDWHPMGFSVAVVELLHGCC